jgi:uncharacterized membrane protein YfcA
VLLGGIEMSLAIGTSLLIISMNSLVGFAKYYSLLSSKGFEFDWSIIAIMIAGGLVGSIAGQWINQYLPKAILQKIFAVFLVLMALFILTKSII